MHLAVGYDSLKLSLGCSYGGEDEQTTYGDKCDGNGGLHYVGLDDWLESVERVIGLTVLVTAVQRRLSRKTVPRATISSRLLSEINGEGTTRQIFGCQSTGGVGVRSEVAVS